MRLLLFCLILYSSANFVFGKPTDVLEEPFTSLEPAQAEGEMSDKTLVYDPMAFPNAMIKVGETLVENDLIPVAKLAGATKTILNTAKKTFDKLQVLVSEANVMINKMNAELRMMQKKLSDFEVDEYFPKFNQAKSELRKVRHRLRELADRTTSETRDLKFLIKEVDSKGDTFFLKLTMKKMKELMVISKDALIEAREKYNKAIENFENLNSSIQSQNMFTKNALNTESEEYKLWLKKVRSWGYGTSIPSTVVGFVIADVFGCMGICSTIGNAIVISGTIASVEGILASYTAELQRFEVLTGDMLARGQAIDETMKEGITFLSEEIDFLNSWGNNVETVTKNIEDYPEEYLQKYKTIRTIFISGLDDLQTTACEFLSRAEWFDNHEWTISGNGYAKTINNPELCPSLHVQETTTTAQIPSDVVKMNEQEHEDNDY